MKRVVVLGGGPAGSMAAARLASAGVAVSLFDEKLAWEKPCGGGITYKAYNQYPFLLNNDIPKRTIHSTWLHSEKVGGVRVDLNQPILIYSRKALNGLLLDRAATAGAQIEQERITGIERQSEGWKIRTRRSSLEADYVVVATGARNNLQGLGTAFAPADTMTALGYYVPTDRESIDIQFFRDFKGYIWVFPRPGHLSVGICGKGQTAQALRARLEDYMRRHDIPLKDATFYGHMLPALEHNSWKNNRVAGDRWLAVGDAAGFVDPITGEGIYYAVRSGDLAGEIISQHLGAPAVHPAMYQGIIAREFTEDLAFGSTIARRVYLGNFLFGPNHSRMVQFLRRSPTFSATMQEVFAGTISYFDFRKKLLDNINGSLAEIGVSFLMGRPAAPSVGS